MKRTIEFLILVLLITLLFPASVCASNVYTEGYFEYLVEEDSVAICGYFGYDSEVTVPPMIAGNPVSRIAKGAFDDNPVVKIVNLPDTIMSIENGAFAQGINVVYNSNTDNPVPSGSVQEQNTEISGSSGKSGTATSDSDFTAEGSDDENGDSNQPGVEETEGDLETGLSEDGSFDETTEGTTQRSRKKQVSIIIGVILAMIVISVGLYCWKKKRDS